MSTSSTQSRGINKRIDSLQSNGPRPRNSSRPRKRLITHNDAYLYALRVTYLAHLLQPRAKRTQYIPAPQAPVQRPSTSINDMLKDFSLVRDSKSTRFPSGFMSELEKRLTGVLMGKERKPEYNDPVVKRSFAQFLNAFTETSFKKRMEKDRRVEELVLIFFSNATKELRKGKAPTDDGWKLMVDRHVALFIRLISLILKDHDWARDRPELSNRLATLETKLLSHDQDLSAQNGDGKGSTIEVTVPLSHEVKDMPLVQVVARIFGLTNTQVQSDINKYKPIWTEKAALQDLKTYQTLLNLNTRKTLRSDDFDLDEAYDSWKKSEVHDLSQMILAILQSNPELAKSTTAAKITQANQNMASMDFSDTGYAESAKHMSSNSETSSYVIDQPVDMRGFDSSRSQSPESVGDDENPFTFIPTDARAYFRFILAQALSHDLNDKSLQPAEATDETPAAKLLSKQTMEVLNEICIRWRIPKTSRIVLFLDVVREKFIDQEIDLVIIDAAFNFIKEPLPDKSKLSTFMSDLPYDRSKWALADAALHKNLLSGLHEAMLRDLYEEMLHCYEQKPPSIGPIMYVLEHYIYDDPSFPQTPEDLDVFTKQLSEGLQQKAHDMYRSFLEEHIPQDQENWEFYNVIQLGKAVVTLAQRIQKRYRKNPEVMGVNPLTALIETILPLYAEDARDIVARIMQLAKAKNEEVPLEDGFQLYGELVEIRQIHSEALPKVLFAFHIEELLANFVWRWIQTTETSIIGWVNQALKLDKFQVRTESKGQIPTQDQRHSVSVIDIFSSFNQTIDRIVQLNWDDDLQYAKFMTALSRIVGTGISRYCEIVEQGFSKEMDRLTPEQEAATHQSTQEKWLQLAKDAWSNKERIEPFQFFPEVSDTLHRLPLAGASGHCADVLATQGPDGVMTSCLVIAGHRNDHPPSLS